MAHTVVITELNAGAKNLVLHIYLKSDGTGDELTDYTIADPKDYGMPEGKFLRLDSAHWVFPDFNGNLKFEYLASDTLVWVLGAGAYGDSNFYKFAGLADRSNPLDGTGRVLLSTRGFGDPGQEGSLVLMFDKSF